MSVQLADWEFAQFREGRTTPTPEAALKQQVCKTLDQLGIFWLRLNSGGYRGRMTGCPKGTADLVAYPKSRPVTWIELKATTKQTSDQKAFQARVEALGMKYLVVRSLGELMEGLG